MKVSLIKGTINEGYLNEGWFDIGRFKVGNLPRMIDKEVSAQFIYKPT